MARRLSQARKNILARKRRAMNRASSAVRVTTPAERRQRVKLGQLYELRRELEASRAYYEDAAARGMSVGNLTPTYWKEKISKVNSQIKRIEKSLATKASHG